MDEKIDPRSVEAMKTFRMEVEKAQDKFKLLEQRMGTFNRDMDTVRVATSDFTKGWKEMGKTDAFKDASKSLDEFHNNLKEVKKLQKETNPPQINNQQSRATQTRTTEAPTNNIAQQRSAQETTNRVEIGTIKIDVSGVTDRTDKEKLAKDISRMVAKELKSKMGGPLSSGGYNRGA